MAPLHFGEAARGMGAGVLNAGTRPIPHRERKTRERGSVFKARLSRFISEKKRSPFPEWKGASAKSAAAGSLRNPPAVAIVLSLPQSRTRIR